MVAVEGVVMVVVVVVVVLMEKGYLKGPPPDFPRSVSFCPLRTMEMKLYDEEKVVWVCLFY